LDFDWVCTKAEFDQWMEKESHKVQPTKVYELPEFNKWIVQGNTNCEFEIITPGHSSELLAEAVKNDPDTIETQFGLIPTSHALLSIKNSHRFKKFAYDSSGWWKTAYDWHLLSRCGAAQLLPMHEEFRKLREAESYAGQKHPKLNVSKNAFFKDDGVQYRYQHDDLHKVVMINDRPAYEYYLKDNEPVLTDKKKFFACDERIRLSGCVEEGLTLSLERAYIPFGTWTADQGFRFAIAKAGSSITSGYFREYIFSHIFDVLKLYNETSQDYYQKFDKALAEGRVRPYDSNSASY
jgi:hypothetical protein